MKKTWKRLTALLCVLLCAMSVTACSGIGDDKDTTAKSAVEYNETELSTMLSEVFTIVFSEDNKAQIRKMSKDNLNNTLNGYSFNADSLYSAMDGYDALVKECGEFVSKGDYKFSADSDSVTMTLDMKMKERDAVMTVIYDKYQIAKSVSFTADYTFAEKMKKAALNTLMGMGTVFSVLILICLLISLFSIINKIQNRENKQAEAKAPAASAQEAAPIESQQENLTSNSQLVAVIAAAIAAFEGKKGTDGFVVRTIHKRRK